MRTLNWLLPVAGAFLLLSSGAHAFLGWPFLRAPLEQAGVGRDLLLALAVGWYFGSVAMAVFGIILFLCWRESKTPVRVGRATSASIALAYVLFGAIAFVATSFDRHFIMAFALPGVVMGLAVVFGRWQP